jgi:hypothetical protein
MDREDILTVEELAAMLGVHEPSSIANPHLQAHADERRLFREVTAAAARECGVRSILFLEGELNSQAIREIGIR